MSTTKTSFSKCESIHRSSIVPQGTLSFPLLPASLSEFRSIIGERKPVIVQFWVEFDWSHKMRFEDFCELCQGRVCCFQVDISTHRDIGDEVDIPGTPAFISFKHGMKVEEIVGINYNDQDLEAPGWVTSHLAGTVMFIPPIGWAWRLGKACFGVEELEGRLGYELLNQALI
ncbi:hypothetical protein JAAARDRAFT_49429 [Jaapia argillacea MUCL 33604]|uniref:Thioredoxin domain-containing protein n=1 Tax=Jaapia argillacea MUCL 33604 TaxID=933084 RepID=A0A067PRZ3_9AGAM|nr:hypothetical protein JAAARDRAFT_49429 [Jaapia argillacea MUCL 33604]